MWISDAQIHRPERLAEVAAIGNDSALDTGHQRQSLRDGAGTVLDNVGDPTGDRGEGKEGKFFCAKPKQRLGIRVCRMRLEALERPVVKQDQKKREADEHGFRHKTEGEQQDGQPIPKG